MCEWHVLLICNLRPKNIAFHLLQLLFSQFKVQWYYTFNIQVEVHTCMHTVLQLSLGKRDTPTTMRPCRAVHHPNQKVACTKYDYVVRNNSKCISIASTSFYFYCQGTPCKADIATLNTRGDFKFKRNTTII